MFGAVKDAYAAWKYVMKMEYNRLQAERKLGKEYIDTTATVVDR